MQEQKANQNQQKNKLAHFRRRRELSQRQMAKLIGHKSHEALCRYETGAMMPSLISALKLEIVVRTPVAFLFPDLYEELRDEIRAKEERMARLGQQDLFHYSPTRL